MTRPVFRSIAFSVLVSALAACSGNNDFSVNMSSFGNLSTGEETHLFTITNSSGASMQVLDYGARIVSIRMPDREGNFDDVIVGPGDIGTFENGDRFVGCVVGRFGNRINGASFSLDGVRYDLTANEMPGGKPVHLHGGFEGFDRKVWEVESLLEKDRAGVRMHYLSPDGEEGYPGSCDCHITYWLTGDNVCRIEYEAETDKPTVINLTNHAYFNLKGSRGGYVMDHLFTVMADSCILNNTQYCPDAVVSVEGTPFDFREPRRVDYRLDMTSRQLEIMHGMSECWLIRGWDGSLRESGKLYDRGSGRGVEIWTTEPALLTYTGRAFDGSLKGKYGPIEKYGGMVLETMHLADSPNQPRFPTTELRPGEKYSSVTEFRFYKE
ncbi:MAG: galactose mutarotase [Bacteroidales bacterium]|nr:galactose mutarotase [Bacteroidales bacterium]